MLYAVNITLFSDTPEGLQEGFDAFSSYCDRWKLKVNLEKTKIVSFRKGGSLPKDLNFYYKSNEIEIVSKFSYLRVVSTASGSFFNAQTTLAGQAQKAIFKLKGYLNNVLESTQNTLRNFSMNLSRLFLIIALKYGDFAKQNK